jgi:hypothetical protein
MKLSKDPALNGLKPMRIHRSMHEKKALYSRGRPPHEADDQALNPADINEHMPDAFEDAPEKPFQEIDALGEGTVAHKEENLIKNHEGLFLIEFRKMRSRAGYFGAKAQAMSTSTPAAIIPRTPSLLSTNSPHSCLVLQWLVFLPGPLHR